MVTCENEARKEGEEKAIEQNAEDKKDHSVPPNPQYSILSNLVYSPVIESWTCYINI